MSRRITALGKKVAVKASFFLLLSTFMTALVEICPAQGFNTIYIRADGSVDPPTPLIQRVGDYYNLTGDITFDSDGIIIERDNMTLDGQGNWLQGYSAGLTIEGRVNITIRNVQFRNFAFSVYVSYSQNITLSRNNMTENGSCGVYLYNSSNCTIRENRIIEYEYAGILLDPSSRGNIIAWNNITRVTSGTCSGIFVGDNSYDNTLVGNTIANNYMGITLHRSTGNVLRNNSIICNEEIVANPHGLYVEGEEGNINHHIHDIDSSNTIDGKPIYYWVDQHDKTVPSDASTVALIRCNNITVQNLHVSKSYHGILLYSTTDSLVSNNVIDGNYFGVRLCGSSRNNVSWNDISANDGYGISIEAASFNNVIVRNNIKWNNYVGIVLDSSSNNLIQNNNVTGTIYSSGVGIGAVGSSVNVTISENIVAQHGIGIDLFSGGNTLSANTITSCGEGIWLSSDNSLSNNTLIGNEFSICVYGGISVGHYVNYVDSSNIVDGKPVYYWVDQHDRTVPSDAGYVFLVSCSRIIVENLYLANGKQGVGLVGVTDSTVRKNVLERNEVGVMIYWSSNVTISQNTIVNSLKRAIEMKSSDNNMISGNNFTGNGLERFGYNIMLMMQSDYNVISSNYIRWSNNAAVFLHYSSGNVVSGNDIQSTTYYYGMWKYGAIVLDEAADSTVVGNEIRYNQADAISFFNSQRNIVAENSIISNLRGIRFEGYTTENRIYRNNIIESSLWLVSTLPNFWDNGYPDGGNYWDSYVDVDDFSGPGQNITGGDGFWDNQLNITQNGNNIDHYPRVAPTKAIARNFESYGLEINVNSNSSVSEFQFNETAMMISFYVIGQTGTTGFCDVAFPKSLLSGTLTVYKDNVVLLEGTDYTQTENNTHYLFHMVYSHSGHKIEIKGTQAIPEFPSTLTLAAFMLTTLITLLFLKAKRKRQPPNVSL